MKKSDVDLSNSVARIKNRVAIPDYYYATLPKDIRALAFYVAGLEKLRQIQMVQRSLENAISNGDSFAQWRDNLDIAGLQGLSSARLEVVYRNNVNTVYNTSTRFNALESDVTPYLMYSAIGDERTRPEHLALDGTIKRADSIFWDRYTPPIAMNCRCGTVPLSDQDAKDMGVSTRSLDSFPKPQSGFGENSYGDVLSATKLTADEAIKDLPKGSPFKPLFKEAVSNIDRLVDIWFKKNQDIFKP